MKNWKIISGIFLLIIVSWHIAIAMTHRLGVAGPFLAKPSDPGYAWTDTDKSESRFFWQNKEVSWQAGMTHPEFALETAQNEGIWNPLPGYAFIDKSQGLATSWQQGTKHPDYMAWADDVEGQWIPVTGYRFIYQGDTFTDSVWDPNKRYDDLKVMSMTETDSYRPFPGYSFVEPGQSLKVVWTPGTPNPDNAQLVAGTKEGSWNVTSNRTQYVARRKRGVTGREVGAFAIGVGAGVILDRTLLRRW